jgi:hypothetical protein
MRKSHKANAYQAELGNTVFIEIAWVCEDIKNSAVFR